MATQTTPNLALPFPDNDEDVDVAADIEALARKIDNLGLGTPVGTLAMWPTPAAPQFWLLCNGVTVPEGTYPKLAAVLGSTGGMITLPDLRGRVAIGAGASQGLGASGGVDQVQLTSGQSGIPGGVKTGLRDRSQGHLHGVALAAAGVTNGYPPAMDTCDWGVPSIGFYGTRAINIWYAFTGYGLATDVPDHQHYTIATNAPEPHENRPPFLAVNFIIRAS